MWPSLELPFLITAPHAQDVTEKREALPGSLHQSKRETGPHGADSSAVKDFTRLQPGGFHTA